MVFWISDFGTAVSAIRRHLRKNFIKRKMTADPQNGGPDQLKPDFRGQPRSLEADSRLCDDADFGLPVCTVYAIGDEIIVLPAGRAGLLLRPKAEGRGRRPRSGLSEVL